MVWHNDIMVDRNADKTSRNVVNLTPHNLAYRGQAARAEPLPYNPAQQARLILRAYRNEIRAILRIIVPEQPNPFTFRQFCIVNALIYQ